MLNLIMKRMPGGHVPQKFRLLFQKSPDQRGLEFYVTGDLTTLKAFLTSRLDMPENAAAKLALEAEASGTSYTELSAFDENEVKLLLRGIAAEEKLAAEGKGKTVQPAGATQ